MDNDVPGTDYCIGFSTCISRTIQLAHDLRTPTGSDERFLVMEVFGRYAGLTAMLPTLAGAADRCLTPEHQCDLGHTPALVGEDRKRNSSNYSTVRLCGGAMIEGQDLICAADEAD